MGPGQIYPLSNISTRYASATEASLSIMAALMFLCSIPVLHEQCHHGFLSSEICLCSDQVSFCHHEIRNRVYYDVQMIYQVWKQFSPLIALTALAHLVEIYIRDNGYPCEALYSVWYLWLNVAIILLEQVIYYKYISTLNFILPCIEYMKMFACRLPLA